MSEITTVLQNPRFIKILAGSIIKEDCPTFSIVQIDFLGDNSYFAVYKSESKVIILEIRTNLTCLSMKESIQKCLNVSNRFHVVPVLVILCIDKIALSIMQHLIPDLENPHWQIYQSNIWAKKCIIIFKDPIISNELDPLMVFTIYFSNDQVQKQKLQDIGNPVMREII